MAINKHYFHGDDLVRSRLRYAGVSHGMVVPRPVRQDVIYGKRPREISKKFSIPIAQAVHSYIFRLPKLPKSSEYTELESYLAQTLHIPEDKTSRPHTHHKRRHLRPRLKLSVGLTGMAVIVLIFGVGVSVQGFLTNKKVEAQVKQANTNNSSNSDSPPQEDGQSAASKAAYRVAPNLPRLIRIPKIKVESRITRLGISSDGKLRSPTNIYDTGWFEGSAKPNESGAMLLAGHVHGPTKPGIFYNLHKLVTGDTFEVERGDGQVFNYKVVETKTFHRDNVDMAAAMTPFLSGERGLNIITCSGYIDESGNHYEDRLIVFAVQQ